jgi:hypothetical protein
MVYNTLEALIACFEFANFVTFVPQHIAFMSHCQCPLNSKLETQTNNNYAKFVSPTGTFLFVHQFFQDTPLYKYFEHPCDLFSK